MKKDRLKQQAQIRMTRSSAVDTQISETKPGESETGLPKKIVMEIKQYQPKIIYNSATFTRIGKNSARVAELGEKTQSHPVANDVIARFSGGRFEPA